jgi:UDP-hydrolysing UDP-N-acetyl-D-glucosamine 2-epimerase
MRTVGVVTVARSDYGIYRPVLRALADRGLDVALYVGGAHLVERLGATVREVEADGYPIVERVSFLDENDDSSLGTARALGRGVVAFADAFDRSRPDMLLVLGDRYEMFAAVLAALPLSLPVAHIHGGESTEGVIDDSIRHSMTKLSHLHFASTEEYARRIEQLGEERWRITVSGAPALDEVVRFEPLPDDELARLGVTLRDDTLLATYHPLTLARDGTLEELERILGAVEDSGHPVVFTYPGSDMGYGHVIERIEGFANRHPRAALVPNLGTRAYFTLMSRAAAMVGNSSSGIIEAASFRLPVVDVGRRQQGRLRAQNVIHVDGEQSAIVEAIATATSPEFRLNLDGLINPYGDGNASRRIAARLADVELDTRLLIKHFHDADA